MVSQHLPQGGLQEMGCRVVKGGLDAAFGIHPQLESVSHPENSGLNGPVMNDHIGQGSA
jgi:hypothetical protein